MGGVEETAAALRALHPALVCDVLDTLGFRDSALGPHIAPLRADMVVAGRAFTLQWEAVDAPPAEPYTQLLAAFAHLEPGDVIVMEAATDASAIWGELLTTAAIAKGVVGAVMDGPARDLAHIIDLGFPVFATGATPIDAHGRQEVVAYQTAIRCGAATVRPGDWIFGDLEGAAVIPAELLDDALRLAAEKNRGESTVRDELRRGVEIGEVFERYGIL